MGKVIIITGGDANFFPYMFAALSSLRSSQETASKDFGIIDQGLTDDQLTQLTALGCRIVQPEWTLPVPDELRLQRNIGLVARTALRDYFPGYEIYLWFDADAWMQQPDFLQVYTEGASTHGAAVALENGPGYRRTLSDIKWWTGNMIAAYGLLDGISLSLKTSINIGVLCLKDTAPHWDAWVRKYTHALQRIGKVNSDQHAFLAAIHLENLPTALLPARNNWLPHLSCPVWNPQLSMLCEPVSPYRPVSVIHLAGPRKDRPYEVPRLDGGVLNTSLTYPMMQRYLHQSSSVVQTFSEARQAASVVA